MSNNCIEIYALSKVFGNKTAVNNLNLSIQEGGIHAIVGSNGAGKSTLFRILLGVETPTHGKAMVLGEDASALTPQTRGQIGYVNEEHTLPAWMKVSSLLSMQKELYSNWNETVYQNVIAYFDVQLEQKISELSRGERAGFNLAMALAQSPKILILDEPTLGLDVVAKQSFLEALMFSESEHQSTIIYCSHQMEEVERVADQLIILEKGRLTNNSAPEEFVQKVTGIIADFGETSLDPKTLEGLLSVKRIDDYHHLMFFGEDYEHLADILAQGGVTNISHMPVSLNQAVNAFLSKYHNGPAKKKTMAKAAENTSI